jgi:hypothetical protein
MANSSKMPEKLTNEELVCKLKEIQLGLKQTLANLREELKKIDRQREFFGNLEILKEDAEEHANELESEVQKLREDLESVRDLLGVNKTQNDTVES